MNNEKKLPAEERADLLGLLIVQHYPDRGMDISDICKNIANEIKSAESAAVRAALIESFGPEYRKVEAEGFQRGQIEMRERAASITESGMFNFECSAIEATGIVRRVRDEISIGLRALPLSPDSGGKGEK